MLSLCNNQTGLLDGKVIQPERFLLFGGILQLQKMLRTGGSGDRMVSIRPFKGGYR